MPNDRTILCNYIYNIYISIAAIAGIYEGIFETNLKPQHRTVILRFGNLAKCLK